jgi:hypothetical protein
MHLTTEDENFTDILGLEFWQNSVSCFQSYPGTFTWFGAKVAVGAAIKAFVGGDDGICRAVGDGVGGHN